MITVLNHPQEITDERPDLASTDATYTEVGGVFYFLMRCFVSRLPTQFEER